MADTGFEDAPKALFKPDVRKLFVAYLVTYGGAALAPIAMAFNTHAANGFILQLVDREDLRLA